MGFHKKSIGLITWIGGGNYGTTLQCFALSSFLRSKGYNCYYIYPFDYHKFTLKMFIRSILRSLGLMDLREIKHIKGSYEPVKYLKLREFLNNNIIQKHIENTFQYHKLLEMTDVFCVGSDQLWNAYYNFNPFNFLDFVKSNKRISYAASMGTIDFPKKYCSTIKELLNSFAHISMRENAGNYAVSVLTGRKDIKTVVDPTFLLSNKEWIKVANQAKIGTNIPDKYILCYFIGNNAYYTEQVKNVQKALNIYNVIDVSIVRNPTFAIDNSISLEGVGIAEFLYLLQNASWVCTDSFHATVLSINMGKNFTELLRFEDTDKASQNSRIYDVLKTFGLQDRMYSNDEDNWSKPVNFDKPSAILDNLRKDSVDWLINAIEH